MSRASVEKVKDGAIKKTVICSTFAGVLVMGLCAHDLTFDVLPLVDLPMNIFIYALVIYGGGEYLVSLASKTFRSDTIRTGILKLLFLLQLAPVSP